MLSDTTIQKLIEYIKHDKLNLLINNVKYEAVIMALSIYNHYQRNDCWETILGPHLNVVGKFLEPMGITINNLTELEVECILNEVFEEFNLETEIDQTCQELNKIILDYSDVQLS